MRSSDGRKSGRRQVCFPHSEGQTRAATALGSASSAPAFALRHLAKSHRGVQLSAQRGHGASPPPPTPRSPSLACNPSGRGGQPETPGHPPTLSCGRGIGEGEEGGGGGGRAVAGRRGQPGLRCSRRPGTTDGGGKRGGREGGSEGGGRERMREGGREEGRDGGKGGRREIRLLSGALHSAL